MMFFRTALALVALACAGPVDAAAPAPAPTLVPALERALHDMCRRQVVLLGEASHGDGATEAAKVALVQALVDRCGFRAVLFEASRYAFADLNWRLHEGQPVGSADLSEAVGGIWNADEAFQPLLPFLAERARRGRVHLDGIDYQVGSRGAHFETERLAGELVTRLPQPEADICRETLRRRIWSDYQGGYDDAEHDHVLACLDRIVASLRSAATGSRSAMLRDLALSFRAWVVPDRQATPVWVAARDRAMAGNVLSALRRLTSGTKTVIWAANEHVARISDGEVTTPMGGFLTQTLHDRMFSLGFTAEGGRFRWTREESHAVNAAAGSLERRALRNSSASAVYLDHRNLVAMGTLPAGVFFHMPQAQRWSDALDGLVVLREEAPAVARPAGGRAS